MTSVDFTDPYIAHDRNLRTVHAALTERIAAIVRTPSSDVGERIESACRPLLWHHHAEDMFLFARLRRVSPLRTSDVAFLERWDREHVEMHAICERLLALQVSALSSMSEIMTLSRELLSQFARHAADEEVALSPEHLREMITKDDLLALAREAEAARPR